MCRRTSRRPVPKKKRGSVVPFALAATVVIAAGAFYVMARGEQHDDAGATSSVSPPQPVPSASPPSEPVAAAPGRTEPDDVLAWTGGTQDAPAPTDGGETADARAGDAGPTEAQVRAAMRSVPVTVYMKPTCAACARTREFLTLNGITHVERDVEANDQASAALEAINPKKTLPTFDVDGQIILGLNEQVVLDAVAASLQKRKGMRIVWKARPQ